MTRRSFHLAQVNIARMRAPLEDPLMAGFVARLEAVNALADASPGFLWRLQTEQGDATALQAFDDPSILINMSVWESVEALHAYVYCSDHRRVLQSRKDWFLPMQAPHLALWWIAAGQLPSVDEAKERLALLERLGPTAEAFTFARRFAPPSDNARPLAGLEECPWSTG